MRGGSGRTQVRSMAVIDRNWINFVSWWIHWHMNTWVTLLHHVFVVNFNQSFRNFSFYFIIHVKRCPPEAVSLEILHIFSIVTVMSISPMEAILVCLSARSANWLLGITFSPSLETSLSLIYETVAPESRVILNGQWLNCTNNIWLGIGNNLFNNGLEVILFYLSKMRVWDKIEWFLAVSQSWLSGWSSSASWSSQPG